MIVHFPVVESFDWILHFFPDIRPLSQASAWKLLFAMWSIRLLYENGSFKDSWQEIKNEFHGICVVIALRIYVWKFLVNLQRNEPMRVFESDRAELSNICF